MNVAENPVILRQLLHQIKFHLLRFRFFCNAKLLYNPLHMGIHNDTGVMVDVSTNDVGGLTSNTGK